MGRSLTMTACDNGDDETTPPLPPALHDDLSRGLSALGLADALAPPLLAYLALLDRWNHTYNLTAMRDPRRDGGPAPARFAGDAPLRRRRPRWPTSAPAPACPAFRWRSPSRRCRSRWSKATARRRASCAKPCARSACRTRASSSRAPRTSTNRAPTTPITARALDTLAGHPRRRRPPAGARRTPAGDEGRAPGRGNRRTAARLDASQAVHPLRGSGPGRANDTWWWSPRDPDRGRHKCQPGGRA